MNFSIRELLVVTAVVGLALGWWLDHRRSASRDTAWHSVFTDAMLNLSAHSSLQHTFDTPDGPWRVNERQAVSGINLYASVLACVFENVRLALAPPLDLLFEFVRITRVVGKRTKEHAQESAYMDASVHRSMLDEIDRDIARLQAAREYHASKLNNGAAKQPVHAQNGNHGSTTAVQAGGRFKSMNQREAATAVLKEAGKPLRSRDIVELMVAGGFPKPERGMPKLANALFTVMNRNPAVFKKVGSGLWDLANQES